MIKIINKLYNCPIGTNLYSPIFGEGVLFKLTNVIKIKFNGHHNIKYFDEYGRFSTKGECMLFPSKENRNWDNFNPILDGDILFVHTKQNYKFVYIYKNSINSDVTSCCVNYDLTTLRLGFTPLVCENHEIVEIRKANKFEIEKILNELHKYGYVWDNELKDIKLHTFKFKCGDKLLNKKTSEKTVVTDINDSGYKLSTENNWISFNDVENDYELIGFTQEVIMHFDFSKLEPFDKVLVRNEEHDFWKAAFFDKYLKNQIYPFRTISKYDYWKQCMPYNDNTKHFKDTAKQMPDFYKLGVPLK
jgi:hypothetical protein